MECSSCGREVHREHIFVNYPCKHVFHMKCLDTRESAFEYTVICPICNVPDSQPKTPLIFAFYKTRKWLNVGDDIELFHRDIKIDIITALVQKRYKSYEKAISRMKISNSDADIDVSGLAITAQHVEVQIAQSDNNNNNNNGFMSKLLPTNWLSQPKEEPTKLLSIECKQEFKEQNELSQKAPLLEVIGNHEDIVFIYYKGYSMNDAIVENIKLTHMVQKGYGIIDWLMLGATWTELITLELSPDMIDHCSAMVDISSLIEVYRLKFHDVYVTLCKKSMSKMAKLRLCKQDFINIGFSVKRLKKYNIELDNFKVSPLWKTLTTNEWNELLEDSP